MKRNHVSLFEVILYKKCTETNSILNIFVYFSYSETSQKRNKDINLNYFTCNSFTELIVLFSLLPLYMNMEIYELRYYLLLHFQFLKFHMFNTKIKQVIIYSEK